MVRLAKMKVIKPDVAAVPAPPGSFTWLSQVTALKTVTTRRKIAPGPIIRTYRVAEVACDGGGGSLAFRDPRFVGG